MKVVLLTTFNHPNGWEYLKALKERGVNVQAVIANYDPASVSKVRSIIEQRVKGEMELLEFSDMNEMLDVPFYFVSEINSQQTLDIIKGLNAAIVVFAADVILGKQLLARKEARFVNCHPALLPQYRGCNALEWPIYEDNPIGSTCHIMDEGIDTGAIVYQEEMPIEKGESYQALRARSLKFTAKVLAEGVFQLTNGIKPVEQVIDNGKYYERMTDEQIGRVKEILNDCAYSHYYSGEKVPIGE